ncbi:hypothetical protein KCP76_22500 [Salmonella enterica subsp. enterica serovar Weltevreden]|nr:hypothetical protein KCP76_22500 [Salmonella enterica subsp. enterica serovar Weltevreden]
MSVPNACRPKRSSIPASIAAAREWGDYPHQTQTTPGVTPHSTIRALATMNMPTKSLATIIPGNLLPIRARR